MKGNRMILNQFKKLALICIGSSMLFTNIYGYAENEQQCLKRCQDQADKMQYATQSGATMNALDACEDRCKKLGEVQNNFKQCIKNAHTEKEKKECRESYMGNRPKTD